LNSSEPKSENGNANATIHLGSNSNGANTIANGVNSDVGSTLVNTIDFNSNENSQTEFNRM
jgi:hypothetical protein